jgi:hypothetical protein
MKTWTWVVLAIVIIGGGAYWWMQQDRSTKIPTYQEQTSNSSATSQTTQTPSASSATQNKPIHYATAAVEIYPSAMTVSPVSGTAPLKVTFSNFASGCANETDLYFGDTPSAMASNGYDGTWPAGGVVHSYTTPGIYTAELYCSSSPITLEKQVTITVR